MLKSTSATRNTPTESNCRTDLRKPGPRACRSWIEDQLNVSRERYRLATASSVWPSRKLSRNRGLDCTAHYGKDEGDRANMSLARETDLAQKSRDRCFSGCISRGDIRPMPQLRAGDQCPHSEPSDRSVAAGVLLRQEPAEEEEEEEATAKKMTMITTQTTTATRSERALTYFSGRRVKREHFVKLVEEALDSLPQEFRSRIRNVTVLVEDAPRKQPSPQSRQQRRLLLRSLPWRARESATSLQSEKFSR